MKTETEFLFVVDISLFGVANRMSESCLSYRITLCKSIETFNEKGCLEVIRLLGDAQNESTYKHLNQQHVVSLAMQTTKRMSVELLKPLDNTIKDMIGDRNYTTTKKRKSIDNNESTTISTFPFMRLPKDIIRKLSFYLNEKDIFIFEKCCRLFYQMINNLSYLKQSNNFKMLRVDYKRLNQMAQSKHSFYKYSQSRELNLVGTGKPAMNIDEIQKKWANVKKIDKKYDHWLTSLFKSIESLTVNGCSMFPLLCKIPIEMLFFSSQSKLQSISFIDSYPSMYFEINNLDILLENREQFDEKYLILKRKCQQQRKKIKILQQVECHIAAHYCPGQIESTHLSIMGGDFSGWMNHDLFARIRVLTCKNDFHVDFSLIEINHLKCQIDTLRLIAFNFLYTPTDICVNKKLIELLKLQENLKNLTLELALELDLDCMSSSLVIKQQFETWIEAINTILTKEYFYHLENVNLLLYLCNDNIEPFLNLLKKHCKLLKNQFKQLNICVKCEVNYLSSLNYYTFSWDSTIGEKYLDKKAKDIIQEKDDLTQENQLKYNQWKQQWC